MTFTHSLGVALFIANFALAGATCFKYGMDMGNPSFNPCGYAQEAKVFAGPGHSKPSWVENKHVTFENVAAAGDLDSPDDCQALCRGVSNAAYFAYEPNELCVCKEAMSRECNPIYGPYSEAMVAGPVMCAECFKGPGIDMGSEVFNPCGYAPEVHVFAGPGHTMPNWVSSKGIPYTNVMTDEELDSPADCQVLCQRSDASYFAYEPGELCVCKNGYGNATCVPIYGADSNHPHITSGATLCSDCMQKGMDMGGGTNNCSYAPEVIVFAKPGYTFPGWLTSKNVTGEHVEKDTDLDTPTDCQELCLQSDAAYFAYEPDEMCVCKNAYADNWCSPVYEADANLTSGPTRCGECLMEGYDVAGNANSCGYAKEVVVYGGPLFEIADHGWITDKGIPIETAGDMSGPLHCREKCAAHEGTRAAFFVYDWTKTRCICKAAYGHPMCSPQFQKANDDEDISGPVKCTETMMTCASLKKYYRTQHCCGQPSRMIRSPTG